VVKENYRKFQCSNKDCDFALWKSAAGRLLEGVEIDELIEKKQVGPLQGFRSKKGFPSPPSSSSRRSSRPSSTSGNNQDADGAPAEVDFTGKETARRMSQVQVARVRERMSYICEKSVGAARNCDFRSGTIILQQPIERAQMTKLLTTGKTGLLTKFVSKKNGRTFKAFLAIGKDGKISFEFEPRAPKGKGVNTKDGKPEEPAPKTGLHGAGAAGDLPKVQREYFPRPGSIRLRKRTARIEALHFQTGEDQERTTIDVMQLQKLLKDGKTDLFR